MIFLLEIGHTFAHRTRPNQLAARFIACILFDTARVLQQIRNFWDRLNLFSLAGGQCGSRGWSFVERGTHESFSLLSVCLVADVAELADALDPKSSTRKS